MVEYMSRCNALNNTNRYELYLFIRSLINKSIDIFFHLFVLKVDERTTYDLFQLVIFHGDIILNSEFKPLL